MQRIVNAYFAELYNAFSYARFIPYLVFLVPMLVSFAGLVIAIFSLRRYAAMLIVWIMGLLGIGVWICNGGAAALNFGVTDLCFEVGEFSDGRMNLVSVATQCNQSIFANLLPAFEDQFKLVSQKVCETLEPHCTDSNSTTAKIARCSSARRR
ncbi:hypothetical protein ERJ75_000042700 [Trypanosoma vivax]|nr:hypothetical protein ERJ75_000042700 [Trypanosoma vivax]